MADRANEQRAQVVEVHVHQHTNHGLLWFLLFGWWYVAWVVCKWLVVTTWKLCVAYPWRWTLALSRWSIVKGRAFHARYGWRGWAILSAAIVVLAILDRLTGGH